jgi:outer membrane protein assembly factor BamB
MNRNCRFAAFVCLAGASILLAQSPEPAGHWPQWRGPLATGVAPAGDPPIEWSETKSVKWKVALPGLGNSTPIIWGERIFVLATVPADARTLAESNNWSPDSGRPPLLRPGKQKFVVLALRRSDGGVLWQKTVRESVPHESVHFTNTWASGSAVTDGERLYASFGSNGLYCLDFEGNLIWQRDLGDMTTRNGFGEGASPALAGDRLIINWDHEAGSFLVALDKKTGKDVWRKGRDEGSSWSTPLVVEVAGKMQIVINASKRIRGYDLDSGKLLWEAPGVAANVVPSPVAANGLAYFAGESGLMAVRLEEATGDATRSGAIVWKLDRDAPYVPSPLLYGDKIYFLKSINGILTCADAATGQRHYSERLLGIANVYASPVGVAGRVYVAGRDGLTAVLARGPQFKVLAVNQLDDAFDASPALADNELYLRGRKSLYRISR